MPDKALVSKAHDTNQVIAIIPAKNCEASITNVLLQVCQAGLSHCVVVANGCTDRTASAARSFRANKQMDVQVCETSAPLGHDVPRAIGALYALRTWRNFRAVVCVDGDWRGTFGNNLAAFIKTARREEFDVAWPQDTRYVADSVNKGEQKLPLDMTRERVDLKLWHAVLATCAPDLQSVSPSRTPLWITRRVFDVVSATGLYHPGVWFARCVDVRNRARSRTVPERREQPASIKLGLIDSDVRWFGNPGGSGEHQQNLLNTLVGDALEGTSILQDRPPTRFWRGKTWIGYHHDRDTQFLAQWASSAELHEPLA